VPALKAAVEKVVLKKVPFENEANGKFAVEKEAVELGAIESDAVENIDTVMESEVSDMKTLNCLLGLQTITKPFQVSNKDYTGLRLQYSKHLAKTSSRSLLIAPFECILGIVGMVSCS